MNAMVQGNVLGSLKRLAPVVMNSCGTFFWLRYFSTAALVGVPTEPYIIRTFSSSTSRRVASTVFGGL